MTAHGHVASHTPGRLRVKLGPDHRTAESMSDIQHRLADRPEVKHVDTRAATGSMIVHYDAESTTPDSLLDLLHDVGLVLHEFVEGEDLSVPSEGPGHSRTANSILVALDDLDRRLSRATGQKLDLKMLFPLTLGAIGMRRLLQSGLGLTEVPAYVLLWYAFDAFYKLHRPPQTEPPRTFTKDDVEFL